jgi:FMN phosphatase YigB (HAD superfamily)
VTIKAVIFDVYGTMLEVGPAPADSEGLWHNLWTEMLGTAPQFTRLEFSVACNRAIAHCHGAARARGIAHPEVNWQSIVSEVIPQFATLNPADQSEFLWRQIRTGHTTRMPPETAEAIRRLKSRGCLLGIASNAQAYTLGELGQHLHQHGLGLDLFETDLTFWSYQHGFSKPDPHVFQLLTTRLALRHISPAQALMVGDRLDNDIEPARAHGWRTWQLCHPGQPGHGSFADLLSFVPP